MYFINGSRCHLRPLATTDASELARWMNDDTVTHLMVTGTKPITYEEVVEALKPKSDEVRFGVYSDRNFIGTTGLYSINPIVRSAELRIFIGDKRFWNYGIGTECTNMVVTYGFDRLNLSVIWLGVNEENKAARRVYEKTGFKIDGLLRRVQYRNGRYYNAHRMSILREEFYES